MLANHNGTWLRGDILGILCAHALEAQTVVTPVSSNSALELSGWFARTERTRIGSPYVIAAMNAALARGEEGVCGYEANGGFLLASAANCKGRTLTALPTRDAVLPIIAVLAAARPGTLSELEARLPARVTHSDRIVDFSMTQSQALVAHLLEGSTKEQMERLNAVFGHSATNVLPSWSLSPLASQSFRAMALKRRLYVPATSRTVWVTEPVL